MNVRQGHGLVICLRSRQVCEELLAAANTPEQLLTDAMIDAADMRAHVQHQLAAADVAGVAGTWGGIVSEAPPPPRCAALQACSGCSCLSACIWTSLSSSIQWHCSISPLSAQGISASVYCHRGQIKVCHAYTQAD